jgi:hypothetical protein
MGAEAQGCVDSDGWLRSDGDGLSARERVLQRKQDRANQENAARARALADAQEANMNARQAGVGQRHALGVDRASDEGTSCVVSAQEGAAAIQEFLR